MLDDGDRSALLRIELGDQFERSVRVVEIVVAELFALQLLGRRYAKAMLAGDVERSALVRVFAVAQRLAQLAAERAIGRRFVFKLVGVPFRNRRIVSACARERFGRELLAQRQSRAAMRLRFFEDRGHVVSVGGDGDEAVILRRCADHRRAANVDILDARLEIGAARDRRFERIEVHIEHIECVDAVLLHCLGMLGIVAQRQQTAVHFRVQRLHAPVHHLRKTRDGADVLHLQPRIRDRLVRAPGRDECRAQAGQRLGMVDEAGLVGDRNEGALDREDVSHGRASRRFSGKSGVWR